ncbi:MAG: hypothetical protein NWR72_09915 [Bacteroidia bacterium]|nr:hypothetical protein [Bacteroidia bacterium]
MTIPVSRVFLAILFLLSFTTPFLSAQSGNIDQTTSNWFQEERFLIADQNDDARLDRSEMKRFPQEFVYFLEDRNFEWADKNHDGLLSFSEVIDTKSTEMTFRFQRDRRDYQQLVREFPLLPQADKSYLKDHPDLVIRLFGNFMWMMENPETAKSIYNDPVFTGRHPEALIALHQNLRWMVVNPANASDLYHNRRITQQLPEFLAWRADHQALIRKYPRTTPLYNLDFIHSGIRVGR